MEDSDMIDEDSGNIADENSVGSQEIEPVSALERPLKRNNRGQFVAGTGSRGHLGGRPKGARDKITTQMIALAQQTIEEHGQAMWDKLAKEDPTACLALISRLLPNKDLSDAIDGKSEGGNEITQVSINLVPAASPRKIEGRTEQQINDRQRGLESPVERIERAPAHDKSVISDDPVGTPRVEGEAAKTTSEASIEAADERAAEAQREQARRYKANTSPSPGYKRGQSSDSTVYLDDPVEDEGDTLRDLYDRGDYI